MEFKMKKNDWIFFILCLFVGITAEEAFFAGMIGISYFVFIVIFYALFFWRFRAFSFSHQRLGYLVLIVIWLLAAGYYLYDTTLFYPLNLLIIPALVIFHLVLITSPKKMSWNDLPFLYYIGTRLIEGIKYNAVFAKYVYKGRGNERHNEVWKKVLIGIAISVPLLFIILNLLIEADARFESLLSGIIKAMSFRGEYVVRSIIALIYTFGFFGFMGALQKNKESIRKLSTFNPISMDGVIALTVLVLLNAVYILFIAVQLEYFFSGHLEAGYTYAEYARRGFFELLFVTLMNLSVTTAAVQWTKNIQGYLKKTIQAALTLLVICSGILLISAFMRLMMYEEAYGFTFTRVLAHSFMIFLMVILAYTLVKIWLERLSLFHFYFIASLLYYSGINVINLDRIVVDQNIARFENTGKIDINYLNSLSSTGIMGLIDLYEKKPDLPGLEELLAKQIQDRTQITNRPWQSYNYTRTEAEERLMELARKIKNE